LSFGQSIEQELHRNSGLRTAHEQSDLARAPGNTVLPAKTTGLPKDSVANPSQIIALDRSFLIERVGRLGSKPIAQILHGIDVVLGR
jgi:mRNA-degrading endonuclease toxin of MazEF toxin-antitoxin module